MTAKKADPTALKPATGGRKLVLAIMGLFLAAVFATSFFTRMDNAPLVRHMDTPAQMMPSGGGEEMDRVRELMRQLSENPDDPALNLAMGEEFLRIGNVEDAQHFLFDALVAEPGNVKVLYLLGLCSLDLAEYEEAAGYFEQSLAGDLTAPDTPGEIEVRNALGVTFFRLDRMEDAAPQFVRIIELEPDNALALLNLATVYNHSGRRDEAVPILEQVLAMDGATEEIKTMAREELDMDPATEQGAESAPPPVDDAGATASPEHDPGPEPGPEGPEGEQQ